MTCKEQIADLVECARRGSQPGRELKAHLGGCNGCRERWESERQLSGQFQTLRMRAAAVMAPDVQGEAGQREILMREFAIANRGRRQRRTFQSWGLALGMAAAVIASIAVGHVAGTRTRKPHVPATRAHNIRNTPAVFIGANSYESSDDASALSSDDFTAIPYTPPLAQGELVRVVHADLYPEALASMGIDVDPVWTGNVPADVVVGEDGIPRAVRISENAQN